MYDNLIEGLMGFMQGVLTMLQMMPNLFPLVYLTPDAFVVLCSLWSVSCCSLSWLLPPGPIKTMSFGGPDSPLIDAV